MNFGEAIKALTEGKKVSREGWNGKGMWVKLFSQSTLVSLGKIIGNIESPKIDPSSLAIAVSSEEVCDIDDFMIMFTVNRTFIPWLASQTDILADDWGIVE
jgi:hypothetical protein